MSTPRIIQILCSSLFVGALLVAVVVAGDGVLSPSPGNTRLGSLTMVNGGQVSNLSNPMSQLPSLPVAGPAEPVGTSIAGVVPLEIAPPVAPATVPSATPEEVYREYFNRYFDELEAFYNDLINLNAEYSDGNSGNSGNSGSSGNDDDVDDDDDDEDEDDD